MKCLYAFKMNEDGSILKSIVTIQYGEYTRKGALIELEEYIQGYSPSEIFIIDGEKISVTSKNVIK